MGKPLRSLCGEIGDFDFSSLGLKKKISGYRDDSVGKTLAIQAWGAGLESQEPV